MRYLHSLPFCVLLSVFAGCGAPEGIALESSDEAGSLSQATTTPCQVQVNYVDLINFQLGDYGPDGYLRWKTSNPIRYSDGSSLTPYYKRAQDILTSSGTVTATQVADTRGGFYGECVSLVKSCANRYVAGTSTWRPGANVLAARNVPVGTAIATFHGQSFYGGDPPNDHTGFFGGYVNDYTNFIMYDQNSNNKKLVRSHLAGTPSAYYVLLVP